MPATTEIVMEKVFTHSKFDSVIHVVKPVKIQCLISRQCLYPNFMSLTSSASVKQLNVFRHEKNLKKVGKGKKSKCLSVYLVENYIISVTRKMIYLAPSPDCSCVQKIKVFQLNFMGVSMTTMHQIQKPTDSIQTKESTTRVHFTYTRHI